MGHVISTRGLAPYPDKVEAIVNMPTPNDVQGVQRVLGMVNYLAKFAPNLSTICEPLRRLMDKDVEYDWQARHDKAFSEMKQLIARAPILQFYDVAKEVTIECDSSSVGLGAVLLQEGRPVAYASRALSKTEQNYAQIEKECLAIVYACERMYQYILGRDVRILSDHKPLMTIFRKPMLSSPRRLQRMRLRLQKYSLRVEYQPGPQMYISDTLSRAALPDNNPQADTSGHVVFQQSLEDDDSSQDLFVTDQRLQQIRAETSRDETLQTLQSVIISGWPNDKFNTPSCVREYWPYRDEMTAENGLVFRATRIIIPTVMRKDMLTRAHAAHLGQEYTCSTAREIMYWPRMSKELIETVQKCEICLESQPTQQKEPMMSHPIPRAPWQSVASDVFEYSMCHYLVVVDLYSDYIEIAKLDSLSTQELISKIKPIFATHGTPAVLTTDNATNYASKEFKDFTNSWDITHVTSSPHHHVANGRAEAAVKTMKSIMKKSSN